MSVNAEEQLLVPLPPGCREGIFIRRHKRFSIEFHLDGRCCWAHSNNTGAMLGLCREQRKILVSPAASATRKLPWTLERVKIETGCQKSVWAGVNTAIPNLVFRKAFENGLLKFARNYAAVKMEAKCGSSRLDACLTGKNMPPMWVECKNVSLVEDNCAAFPDAESARARKHLLELIARKQAGDEAAMFFLVQRPDCSFFAPADYIDPEYAELFYRARKMGVLMLAFQSLVSPLGTGLGKELKVLEQMPC